MSEYSKKGAVSLAGAVCPPMSLHEKSLPLGEGGVTTPMSFSRKTAVSGGGDLRPMGIRADIVLKDAN